MDLFLSSPRRLAGHSMRKFDQFFFRFGGYVVLFVVLVSVDQSPSGMVIVDLHFLKAVSSSDVRFRFFVRIFIPHRFGRNGGLDVRKRRQSHVGFVQLVHDRSGRGIFIVDFVFHMIEGRVRLADLRLGLGDWARLNDVRRYPTLDVVEARIPSQWLRRR